MWFDNDVYRIALMAMDDNGRNGVLVELIR